MEKDIIYIYLSYRPSVVDNKTKNEADYRKLDNRAECIIIINSRSFTKTFGNQTSLKLRHKAVRISFNEKHLFTTNKILGRLWNNKIPGIILKKSNEIIRHCLSSMRVFQSMVNTGGFNRFG